MVVYLEVWWCSQQDQEVLEEAGNTPPVSPATRKPWRKRKHLVSLQLQVVMEVVEVQQPLELLEAITLQEQVEQEQHQVLMQLLQQEQVEAVVVLTGSGPARAGSGGPGGGGAGG